MPEPALPSIQLSVISEDIICVTLDMPGSNANILSQAMLSELEQRLDEIREMDGLKGLILILSLIHI